MHEQWRNINQAVDTIQDSAVPRNHRAHVLGSDVSFDHADGKIAKHSSDSDDQTGKNQLYRAEKWKRKSQQPGQKEPVDQDHTPDETLQSESIHLVNMLMEHGYKVKLTGVATMQDKRHTNILAGSTVNQRMGETMPIAVRINEDTPVLSHTGERLPHAFVEKVRDGATVIAHGKKGKRGVIKAKHVMLLDS